MTAATPRKRAKRPYIPTPRAGTEGNMPLDSFRLPEPTEEMIDSLVIALRATRPAQVTFASLWTLLKAMQIPCDGPSAAEKLLERGLIAPTKPDSTPGFDQIFVLVP